MFQKSSVKSLDCGIFVCVADLIRHVYFYVALLWKQWWLLLSVLRSFSLCDTQNTFNTTPYPVHKHLFSAPTYRLSVWSQMNFT